MRKKHIIVSIAIVATAAVAYHFSTAPPQPAHTIETPPAAVSLDSAPPVAPQSVPESVILKHIGPDNLYPDPKMTPGLADTLSLADLTKTYTDNCPSGKTSCTYSQDHRNVPAAEHTQVYDEYNVPASARNIKSGEVDHFYPLCAGGSNDIKNLWYQPVSGMWNGQDFGFHKKDDLETEICKEIKAGKLDPKEAFLKMTSDWVAFYLELKPAHQTFGNSNQP